MWIVKFNFNGKDGETKPFDNVMAAQLAQVLIVAFDAHCKIVEIGG